MLGAVSLGELNSKTGGRLAQVSTNYAARVVFVDRSGYEKLWCH